MNKGKLYLIPSLLDDDSVEVIPEYVKTIADGMDIYLAENIRTARRYLRKIGCKKEFDDRNMMLLDKNTKQREFEAFIKFMLQGNNLGIISEAGCPCIADPGSSLVLIAHNRGIEVKPLVGPSSILLALMASGLNGQKFAFHGYLSVKKDKRREELRRLEMDSAKLNQTQIFMEAPYRNQNLIEDIIIVCDNNTQFCIAANLNSPKEYIETKSIGDWKSTNRRDLHKQPAIFLINSK